MNRAHWIVAVAITIFLWCVALDLRDLFYDNSLSLAERVKESPLIVYAVAAETNQTKVYFNAREIWKDERKTHSNLIGQKIFGVPKTKVFGEQVQAPDGAVIFFQKKIFDGNRLVSGYTAFVYDGKIENMSLAQFKQTCLAH